MKVKNKSKWYYEQLFLGYNYWISDINASLGISQLKKVKKFVFKRNSIAKIYDHHLKNLPILLPNIDKNNLSSFHLYVIKLTEKNKKVRQDFQITLIRKYKCKLTLSACPFTSLL